MSAERAQSAYGLPKTARLLKPADFVNVLRRPQANFTQGPLRIRAIQNRMPGARMGLVIGKKGNRTAVRRNRIKRIIRETFRHRTDLNGIDIAVQVFGPIEDQQLRADLELLLNRVAQRINAN